MELIKAFLKTRMLPFVALSGAGKLRTRGKNTDLWMGDNYPFTCRYLDLNPSCSGDKQVLNHHTIEATINK